MCLTENQEIYEHYVVSPLLKLFNNNKQSKIKQKQLKSKQP